MNKAIICDIDGTIAQHKNRNIFDYQKCDTDLPIKPTINIIKKYMYDKNLNIIYLTGREDSCREKTIKWLRDQEIYYDWNSIKLYMRTSKDKRKGTIIKEEIYNKYIKDKYKIEFVLEDNLEIVEVWKSLGLICLQVQRKL